MAKSAPMLRSMWAVFGMISAVALVLLSGVDMLIFSLAYGSQAGSYSGQAGDRHVAWLLLTWLVVLWVLVVGGMLWPALRWRRRGMLGPPDAGEE